MYPPMTLERVRGGNSTAARRLFAVGVALLLDCSAHRAQADVSTGPEVQNAKCQKCHGVAGLSVTDPTTGKVTDLTVLSEVYAAGAHGGTPCSTCHLFGYDRLPHHGPRSYPRYLCVDCHENDPATKALQLPLRRDHLRASAHGKVLKHPLDCHDCHDVHSFQLVRKLPAALDRIALSNDLCLGCHGPLGGRRRGYADLPIAEQSHQRFPNPQVHFRKVKCVACHSPLDSATRHDILPAAKSVRECTDCHTRGSSRLAASYVAPGDRADRVRDNAYVVGSTRSETVDRAALTGLALMLALVVSHALARVVRRTRGRRRRRRRGSP